MVQVGELQDASAQARHFVRPLSLCQGLVLQVQFFLIALSCLCFFVLLLLFFDESVNEVSLNVVERQVLV